MTLLAALHDFCVQQDLKKPYWIAYSGGLDSHVLLSLCHTLRTTLPLTLGAIHVNHGLSANADKWAAHCAQICANYAIPYVQKRLHLQCKTGDSLENIARDERYAVLAESLQPGDILLTAHQQDDQAETVLLQLLRGSGLMGLAAMPTIKPLGRGLHGRPLLAFPRVLLQQYANEQQLQWIEDESNQNIKHLRNFIRRDVMPVLKTRYPAASASLARSAQHMAEAEDLLTDWAESLHLTVQGAHNNTLSVKKLNQLDAATQRLVLRYWIKQHQYPMPSTKKMQMLQQAMLSAAKDRMPCVSWQAVQVRRYRDDLYIMMALVPLTKRDALTWDLFTPLSLPGSGFLQTSQQLGCGLRGDVKSVSVRFRQGGEKVEIKGRGHHTLKHLFQEWGVPPWERERIPLIFVNDTLMAVVGYFMDAAFTAKPDEYGFLIHWTSDTLPARTMTTVINPSCTGI